MKNQILTVEIHIITWQTYVTGPVKWTMLAQTTPKHKKLSILDTVKCICFLKVATCCLLNCPLILLLEISGKYCKQIISYDALKFKNAGKFYVPTWKIIAGLVTNSFGTNIHAYFIIITHTIHCFPALGINFNSSSNISTFMSALQCTFKYVCWCVYAELEIAVGHWPFSDQFAPFGRANTIY